MNNKKFEPNDFDLPKKANDFLEEYKALCKKHRLMVLSDGEEVQIGPYGDDLWQIEESTCHWITRFPKSIKELE